MLPKEEQRRCDKCMFWHRMEEDVPIGECKIHNPIPHTTTTEDDEGNEMLVVQALWPAPEADEFCWEFVAKREEPEKKFNQDDFIVWLIQAFPYNEYLVDIYPDPGNPNGISGLITLKQAGDEIMGNGQRESIVHYLGEFFAPEDIDVSFT